MRSALNWAGMKLNYKKYGTAGDRSPLIILHGLFGSSSNWNTIAGRLAERFTVYTMDLRNHGTSPHADRFDYPTLAADILEFLQDAAISQAHLLGHSLGGKTAMQFALSYPQRVEKLIVVDIAPQAYAPHHDHIIDAFESVNLARVQSRQDADAMLAQTVPEAGLRQFLLTNLVRADGAFRWRMNLAGLKGSYANIVAAIGPGTFPKPALFIRGGKSDYVQDDAIPLIQQYFPQAGIETITQAGHWVHAETPAPFLKLVMDFLEEKN